MSDDNKQWRFDITGVNLNAPVDQLPEGYVPVLENWRPEVDGTLSVRPGQGNGWTVVGGKQQCHSARRLVDKSLGAGFFNIIAGVQDRVATVSEGGVIGGPFFGSIDRDGPYSGDPLCITIHRPTESVKPYAYISDRLRMRKLDYAGNVRRIGLPQMLNAPQATLSGPVYKLIGAFDGATGWVNGVVGSDTPNSATVPADALRIDSASITITQILYDNGGTGWATIQPSAMLDIGKGMLLIVDAGTKQETVVVQEVFRGSSQKAIEGLQYESGTTGRCHMHLTVPSAEATQNAILYNSTLGKYARIMSVHSTKDGHVSLIVNTAEQWTAGQNVQVLASFRCYLQSTHNAGAALLAKAVEFSVDGTNSGYITHTGALDLSTLGLQSFGSGRRPGSGRGPFAPSQIPVRPDDYVCFDVFVDHPELLTEIVAMMDIDGAQNDFSKNYFQHVIRSNDLAQSIANKQTLITGLSNQQQRRDIMPLPDTQSPFPTNDPTEPPPPVDLPIEPPPPGNDPQNPATPDQTSAVGSQYAQVRFRVADLLLAGSGKVGSDLSRGLADVAALKIKVTATGTVVVRISGWYVTGGFGPDVIDDANRSYLYAVRARDTTTGAVSNLSPAYRGGARPYRQQVTLTAAQYALNDGNIVYDWFRYGGVIEGWHYLGSSPSAIAGPTFADTFSDLDLQFRDALDNGYNEHYQPWPQLSTPISLQVSGSGCIINITGGGPGNVPLVLAPGTPIRIGGDDYVVYRCFDNSNNHSTSTRIELTESVGVVVAAACEISAPLLLQEVISTDDLTPVARADYFPIFVGPFYGFFFGLGDTLNPGWLYVTNGNDPDSTQLNFKLEVTPPGEPLQNILIFQEQGRAILWSSDRTFVVETNFAAVSGDPTVFPFTVREISATAGLVGRWACCAAGDAAVWAAKDGLYETSGGSVQYLTESLRVLFPHEGSAGAVPRNVSNAYIPDLSVNAAPYARLAFGDRELYFDYLDTNNAMRSLVLRKKPDQGVSGWRNYSYSAAVRFHYADEGDGFHAIIAGGINGKLYKLGRALADDSGDAITAVVRTPSLNGGDARSDKYVQDFWLDYDTDGATLNAYPGFANHTVDDLGASCGAGGVSGHLIPLTDAAGRTSKPLDLNSGRGVRAKNCSLMLSVTVTTQRPVLYIWGVTYSPRPETSLLRGNDYSPTKSGGAEWVRGVWIHADTYNQARNALFEYIRDDGVAANVALTGIQHSVFGRRFYPVPNGIYCTASRLRPTDAANWDFAGYMLESEPAPPYSTQPSAWKTADEKGGAALMQTLLIDGDTQGNPVELQVQIDEQAIQTTIGAAANGGPIILAARGRKVYTFDTPFIAHLYRLIPSANIRIFDAQAGSIPYPELTDDPTDWQHVLGSDSFGAGFIQGLTVDADTGGANVDVQIEVDSQIITAAKLTAGQNMGPLNCNGRKQQPFSFDTPIVGHLARVRSLSPIRLWGVQWHARPEAELAHEWRTQQIAFGKWVLFGDGYISIRSTDDVVFNIIADGVTHAVSFYDAHQNTGGLRRRYRFRCPTFKAKSVEFEVHAVTQAGLVAVVERDFLLQYKEWGYEGAWQDITPLGDVHYTEAPRWMVRGGAGI